MWAVYSIALKLGWTGKTKKLKIYVAAVCTSVKILKIRRMVNKIGGHLKLKWVYLPHSKLEGGGGGLLNRDYRHTPS